MSDRIDRSSRKAASRAYKDARRPAGLYAVRNIATGRTLIGRSNDVPAMLNRIRAQLGFGAHPVADLQSDWRAVGADGFEFTVLDLLEAADDDPAAPPDADLRALEQIWFEKLAADGVPLYGGPPRR